MRRSCGPLCIVGLGTHEPVRGATRFAQNTVHWVALSTGLWLKVCTSMPRKRTSHKRRRPRSKYKFWRENGRWKKLWKTWCIFHGKCWGGDVPVLPLTPKHMHGIAAMFKSCGYTTYDMYVRVAKGMHIQSGAAWSNKLEFTKRWSIKQYKDERRAALCSAPH